MAEELLLRHCSPTLAALKAGNLFTCPSEYMPILQQLIASWNEQLNAKGVEVLLLHQRQNSALIYVFRPALLQKALSQPESKHLLASYGYPMRKVNQALSFLKHKLSTQKEFPHEIGIFLGYPPSDVRQFIQYGGMKGKYDGCWKVYGDEDEAKQKFAQFKKCTNLYLRMHKQGRPLTRLAVRKVYA